LSTWRSHVVDRETLGFLRDHLPPPGTRWQRTRDRALISVLIHGGLAVGEICAMQVGDLANADDGEMHMHISGSSDRGARTLTVPLLAAREIYAWLAVRAELAPPDATLFVQRKGLRAMHPKSVFFAIQQWLTALDELPLMGPHWSPETLRSAVIAEWIAQGLSKDEVIRRAGFRDANALRRFAPSAACRP
jgi:site-specific recombinase XerC